MEWQVFKVNIFFTNVVFFFGKQTSTNGMTMFFSIPEMTSKLSKCFEN